MIRLPLISMDRRPTWFSACASCTRACLEELCCGVWFEGVQGRSSQFQFERLKPGGGGGGGQTQHLTKQFQLTTTQAEPRTQSTPSSQYSQLSIQYHQGTSS